MDAAPVRVVFSETGPVKLWAWVARLMLWLAVRALKFPPAAVNTPLSLTPPVAAVPVNTPPTLDAAKVKLAGLTAAAPAPFGVTDTAPVQLLAEVSSSLACVAALVVEPVTPALSATP